MRSVSLGLGVGLTSRRVLDQGGSAPGPGEDAVYYFYMTAADLTDGPGAGYVGYTKFGPIGAILASSLGDLDLQYAMTGEVNLLIQFAGDAEGTTDGLRARIDGIIITDAAFAEDGGTTFIDVAKPYDFVVGETYLVELVPSVA